MQRYKEFAESSLLSRHFFRRSLIYKTVSYFFILRFCLGEIKKLVQKGQKGSVLHFKNIHLSKFLDPELIRKKGDTIL